MTREPAAVGWNKVEWVCCGIVDMALDCMRTWVMVVLAFVRRGKGLQGEGGGLLVVSRGCVMVMEGDVWMLELMNSSRALFVFLVGEE